MAVMHSASWNKSFCDRLAKVRSSSDVESARKAHESEILKEEEGIYKLNDNLTKMLSSPFGRALRSPIVNGLTSRFGTVKQWTNMVYEHPFISTKNAFGKKTGTSIDAFNIQDRSKSIILNALINKLFIKSAGLEGKALGNIRASLGGVKGVNMKYKDFSKGIAMAMRREDVHKVPEIETAAKLFRAYIDEAVIKMQKLDILPKDLDVKTAASYLTKSYNLNAINAPGGVEELSGIIAKRFAKESIDSTSVLQEVEKTMNNIRKIGDQALEMDNIATNMIRTGGSFKLERSLMIPDIEMEKFLNNDAISIVQRYLQQANSAIRFQEVLEREGFRNLSDVRKALRDEFNAVSKHKGEFDKSTNITDKKLEKELKQGINDINQSARLILGQFGRGTNSVADNAFKTLRKYQMLRMLGGMTVSSLNDAAMYTFKHGPMSTVRDGLLPMLRNYSASTLSKDELKDFGVGLELMMNEILRAMTDGDFTTLAGKSKLGTIGDYAVQNFGKLTLNSYWTKGGKRMAGQMSVSRTFRALKKLDKGESISNKESTRLAHLGIGKEDYAKVWGEFKKHGEEVDGSFVSNFGAWDRDTKEMFGGTVSKDVNSTILTPTAGDIPLIFQSNQFMKTMFQFKSYTASATNKILISGMQRRDSNVLAGTILLASFGAMSWVIKGAIAGKNVIGDAMDDDTLFETALSEGISRGGLTSLWMQGIWALNPVTATTRQSAINATNFIGGPSSSLIQDAYNAAGPIFDQGRNYIPGLEGRGREMTASDWSKVTRMLIYQNLLITNAAWTAYKKMSE